MPQQFMYAPGSGQQHAPMHPQHHSYPFTTQQQRQQHQAQAMYTQQQQTYDINGHQHAAQQHSGHMHMLHQQTTHGNAPTPHQQALQQQQFVHTGHRARPAVNTGTSVESVTAAMKHAREHNAVLPPTVSPAPAVAAVRPRASPAVAAVRPRAATPEAVPTAQRKTASWSREVIVPYWDILE